MNKCPKCGTENEGQWCPECGEKHQKEKTCPHCNATLYEGAKFCPHCGYSFVPPKKIVVANWLKARKKKIIIAASSLILVMIVAITLSIAIPVGIAHRHDGTYYLYQFEEYVQDQYFTLKGGKWENQSGEKGSYKVSGDTILLSQNVFGQTVTFSSGTIKNGVMTLSVFGAEMVYAKHKHKSGEWLSDDSVHWKICSDCGKQFNYAEHINSGNSFCKVCNTLMDTQGLSFTLNSEKTGYILTDGRSIKDKIIRIPSEYNGLPVVEIRGTTGADWHGAFSEKLQNIVIPNSITTIGEAAFYKCTGLKSIVIPDSVTSIGDDAFFGCSSLTSAVIGDSVTSIGYAALWGCSKLKTVEIPNSVTSIKGSAFSGINITVQEGNPIYHCEENCLIETASNTLVSSCKINKIPNSVTRIGSYAFYYRTDIKNIEIPSSITSIGECAFQGCSKLTSITIPDSVTSIGDQAFYYCSGLTSVYFNGTTKDWDKITIRSNYSPLTYATRYYYSETAPTEEGNYWHYDADMVPTPWVKEN